MTRHHQFTVDGEPFLSLGGQARNSSAFTPADADHACRSVVALGGNTVAFPVSWEVFEATEGSFDREFVTTLVDRVRSYGLHLVVLWFASWKNGTMEYAPRWVKTDQERFPRTRYPDGSSTFVLSAHAPENCAADARAFAALLATLRDHDADVGTVLAVQVENEAGILAPVGRDFGPDGEEDFAAPVPAELLEHARRRPGSRLDQAWAAGGRVGDGSWPEVFGAFAAEACSAWHVARYVDTVAAAGKAEFDLPLSVNAWGDTGLWGVAGLDYPSGGPVGTTGALDVWRAATSSIDLICPDVYAADLDTYRDYLDTYGSPEDGWPLFVPESANGNPNPAFMVHAVAGHGSLGHHVFAVEDLVDLDGAVRPAGEPFVRSFAMLLAVEPLLHTHRGTDRVHAVVQSPGQRQRSVAVEGWRCGVTFSGPEFRWNGTDFRHREELAQEFVQKTDLREELGRGVVVQAGPDEFFLVGHHLRVFFHPTLPVDGSVPYSLISPGHQATSMPTLAIEEGHFADGEFVVDRVRTGDEARHGIWLAADCGVVRVLLHAGA